MKFDTEFFTRVFAGSLKAIPLTLYVSLWAFIFGLLIGIVIALIRYRDIPVLRKFCQFYVSFLRGTPALLQLYIIYYMIPMVIDAVLTNTGSAFRTNQIPTQVLVVIAFAINCSAYLSEIIRGGLAAVGKGEIEAAYSIGMTDGMVIRTVIIPQVLTISLPNLSTNLIAVVHASSLAYFVSLLEVTGTAKVMASSGWKYFEAFVATGIIYWFLTVIIELLTFLLEKLVAKRGYGIKQNA